MMTDEELQEAKDFLGKSEIPAEWRINLGGMIMKSYRTMKNLLAHVDEQASQIATLKAALINRYAKDIRFAREAPTCFRHPDETDTSDAKKQLAQEYPEIFAEEKK
jgi:hypothetical protein